MQKKINRNFIIFSRHKRLTRLWQFLFTGWGLVMLASLVAGALFTKQLLWTPISAINMLDIATNQFKMQNASFAGTDKNGEPFTIMAKTGLQKYAEPDIIYLFNVNGTTVRITDGQKTKSSIQANNAKYERANKRIVLTGNVIINSSNGDKIKTSESL